MRRPLNPRRPETRLETLMWHSSSKHSRRVSELDAIARRLVLAPRDRPPQPLRHLGYKAERELVCGQSFDESFGIREIFLATARSVVGLRLRQMQRAGCRHRTRTRPPRRLPRALQRIPDWAPVLR